MYIDDVSRQPIEKAMNDIKPERQILPNSPVAIKSPIILPWVSFFVRFVTSENDIG